jgi:arylsulfatase A-like enzyme
MPLSEIMLSELLRAAGYRTGITGKWHLGYQGPYLPQNRGFDDQYGCYEAFTLYAPESDRSIVSAKIDVFSEKHMWRQGRRGSSAIRKNGEIVHEKDYFTFAVAREASAFIRENKNRPFYLYVPFTAPHTPYQVPKTYYDRFTNEPSHVKRVYYGMIEALDDAVGTILDAVRQEGLEENTLIFFASDNGITTSTGVDDGYPLKGGKFSYFEGGIRVPAIASWKGKILPGQVIDEPVMLFDFFTTAVTAAGLGLPDDRPMDGVDLIPFLTGKQKGTIHPALFWRTDFVKTVRRGEWKLIVHERDGWQRLYRLSDDLQEETDLSDRYPEIRDSLKNEILNWEKDKVSPLWPRVMDYRMKIDGKDYFFPI